MTSMTRIGIIGLGDIAQKAYLPILSSRNLEIHLYTRDQVKLKKLSAQYRLTNIHHDLQSLIDGGIKAAFVHSSTETHESIVEALLDNNIHVFVDKPITYDFSSTKKLIELAKQKNLILTAGFNRRFAPAYLQLKQLPDPNMIIMQKNRVALPGEIRRFIFDDFIHVVDTLLFLFPYPIHKLFVNGKKAGSLLNHVVIQLVSMEGNIAIGIMNRESGTLEEKLEVFSAREKQVVYNVTDLYVQENRTITNDIPTDWNTTLYKRGFDSMIDSFLQSLDNPGREDEHLALKTHQLCEQIVNELTGQK
jgi:virulence factor